MKKRLKIVKLFTEHPESVGESYIHHFLYACISGIKLIFAGIACVIHSIFPFIFVTTASDVMRKISDEMSARRDGKNKKNPESF